MKVYNYKNRKIRLGKATYNSNNTLAVVMLYTNEWGEEDEEVITTNIDDSDILADDTQAFVDTNNMGNGIVQWLVKNKIAIKTPFFGCSGYCKYPLMIFTKEALDNMVEIK